MGGGSWQASGKTEEAGGSDLTNTHLGAGVVTQCIKPLPAKSASHMTARWSPSYATSDPASLLLGK